MDERLDQSCRELSDTNKKCKELEAKIGQPFEHEAKLQGLTQRQQELENALDITKNQAPNTLASEESTEPEIVQTKATETQKMAYCSKV
jgi:hypothetical protein